MSEIKELPIEITEKMSSFRLGKKRVSMKSNAVLAKAPLGQRKPNGQSLPDDQWPNHRYFIYGKPNKFRDGGTQEAMCWNSWKPKLYNPVRPKDFIKLNAQAAICGFANSKEISYFRAANDYRLKAAKPSKLSPIKGLEHPSGKAFGKPTRSSTPVGDIIKNRYGASWLANRIEEDAKIKEKIGYYKTSVTKPRLNRAAQLAYKQPQVEPAPYWHMKKWKNVGPHLETFKNPEVRRRAFKLHQSDACGRTGIFGHGLFERGHVC